MGEAVAVVTRGAPPRPAAQYVVGELEHEGVHLLCASAADLVALERTWSRPRRPARGSRPGRQCR
jgi:hypothetical protein